MKHILAVLGVFLLGGCITDSLGGGPRKVTVSSDPAGALLTIDGIGECETPCRVTVDQPRRARLAKAGFLAKDFTLTPARREVLIAMDLAAPSGDVDAAPLPDLE